MTSFFPILVRLELASLQTSVGVRLLSRIHLYIRNNLDHLNQRKAVGVDGISPRILRLGSPVLAEKVTKLISFYILNRFIAV